MGRLAGQLLIDMMWGGVDINFALWRLAAFAL
jgi:hypothetical protein